MQRKITKFLIKDCPKGWKRIAGGVSPRHRIEKIQPRRGERIGERYKY